MKKQSLRTFGLIVHSALTRYMARAGLMAHAIAPSLDKTAHAALPEAQRGWYAADGEGFKLDPAKIEFEDTVGLKTALEKERDLVKAARAASKQAVADALKVFEGIDPVKTRALLSKFDNEEEAALIAAGKVDEVISKRMTKHTTAQQKLLDEATAREKIAVGVADTFKGRVLDNHIRAAAAKSGLHPFAVEDALLRARSLFSLDAQGDAVQLGADGAPVLGKDGKTAFTPAEWLEGMKETAPHWFPSGSSGGGAGGSGGAGAGGKTMTRAQFDGLSAAERVKAAKTLVIVD